VPEEGGVDTGHEHRGEAARRVAGLAGRVADLVRAGGREDLARDVVAAGEALGSTPVRVLVIGEYKKGKSSLVNGLVGAAVCPVDDDAATSVPTSLVYANAPSASARYEVDGDGRVETRPIPAGDLSPYVTEGVRALEGGPVAVEVGMPLPLLAPGLVVVDTPGVGGLVSAHAAATYAALPSADAVVFVTDAGRELTAAELEFLQVARAHCPTMVGVLTKTDFFPAWRRILALDEGHLRRVGLPMPVFAVSTMLRQRALADGRDDLDEESGYPDLLSHVDADVVAHAEAVATRAAAHDQMAALEQVEAPLRAEQAALSDPGRAEALVAALEAARARREELRGESTNWSRVLDDGVADVDRQVEFDLRDRFRRLEAEVTRRIDAEDPGETWAQLEAWIRQRVGEEVGAAYLEMSASVKRLAERVAERFVEAGGVVLAEADAGPSVEGMDLSGTVAVTKAGLVKTAVTALQGGSSEPTVLGIVGSVVGFTITAGVSAAIGLVLGVRAIREEKARRLAERRAEARSLYERYAEEVQFRVGKQLRDALRDVRDQLREDVRGLAARSERAAAEALGAAQRAVRADRTEGEARLTAIAAQLAELASVRADVAAAVSS
jgi:hypothetical protein